MAYLTEVFRVEAPNKLLRRQSPLMIDDQLMMVMDLTDLDIFHDDILVDKRELEEFTRKYRCLTEHELVNAFTVEAKDVLNILTESIPCVGCRRSVERLYYQLMGVGELALDPLYVNSDSKLSIRKEVLKNPVELCNILSEHNIRLNQLISSQPRNKKSRRCILHSFDLQKGKAVTPAWKEVWSAMHEKCKTEVLLIDFTMLLSKLENYLKKHRFCQDCRTKVMKAYSLLVEDGDPTKEKGFVPALYQKIKRCTPGKHLHLSIDTKYIDSLISRAEPELMGNRRDRHAKTMEIAQEEVLTCVGMCIYDRIHRIYLRLREEESTCLVLAAAAVEALVRSFETSVENKRGVSRLELLCQEITKEELVKRQRKEMKKLKKKRKKEKKGDVKDECECESDDLQDGGTCDCPKVEPPENGDRQKLQILDRKTKGQVKCECDECREKQQQQQKKDEAETGRENGDTPGTDALENCLSCEESRTIDGGYGSAQNLPSSGSNSSPDGSEVACSEGFCDHDGDCVSERRRGRHEKLARHPGLSLEEMLERATLSQEDDEEGGIPLEEIRAFQAKSRQVDAKRLELRATLRDRFDQFCNKAHV